METTKSSPPSSSADASDDLIEELARLMADDAQINTPSPRPVPTPPKAVAENKQAASAPEARAKANEAASGSVPEFGLSKLDLGAPKAETSPIEPNLAGSIDLKKNQTREPGESASLADTVKQEPQQDSPDTKDQDNTSSSSNSDSDSDFDFGFGAEQSSKNSGVIAKKTASDPDTTSSGQPVRDIAEPTSDPIADLINAAVTKHDHASKVSEQPVVDDSFNTPPVFGVGGTTSPSPAPKTFGGSMALDEIETLIGDSAQASPPSDQRDENAQVAVEGLPIAPAPVVVPAESGIATLPADSSQTASTFDATEPDSAEAAILQAMAAAGTASGIAAKSVPDSEEPELHAAVKSEEPNLATGRVESTQKPKRSLTNYLVPLAGILFVGAIGVGAYFWLNPAQSSADAPVLIADGTATRVAPTPAEQVDESVVLSQMDGDTAPAQTENLVSRDQTEGTSGSEIRQVVTADNSEAGLANRRVRTVTVRPDGTIISGEDAVAGGQVLPVEQPNLPELPANAVNTELSNTTVAALPESPAASVNVQTVTVNGNSVPFPQPRLADRAVRVARASVVGTELPATTGLTPSPLTSAVNLIAEAPAPEASAPITPSPAIPAVEVVSIVDEAPAAPPPATSAVANPQAYVQMASQRSQSTANATAASLQSQYSSTLNGGTLVVRRVDLGTRGIYYRVQLPMDTLRSANSICNAIKGAGGDCFVRSN